MNSHSHGIFLEVELCDVGLSSLGAGAILVKVGVVVQRLQVRHGGGLVGLGLVLVGDVGVKVGLGGGSTHGVKVPVAGPNGLRDVGQHGGGVRGAGLGVDLLSVGEGSSGAGGVGANARVALGELPEESLGRLKVSGQKVIAAVVGVDVSLKGGNA